MFHALPIEGQVWLLYARKLGDDTRERLVGVFPSRQMCHHVRHEVHLFPEISGTRVAVLRGRGYMPVSAVEAQGFGALN